MVGFWLVMVGYGWVMVGSLGYGWFILPSWLVHHYRLRAQLAAPEDHVGVVALLSRGKELPVVRDLKEIPGKSVDEIHRLKRSSFC